MRRCKLKMKIKAEGENISFVLNCFVKPLLLLGI